MPAPDAPWGAPARIAPPGVANERSALAAFLDYHRATFLTKCAGLDGEQLARQSCPPSSLSLLGLLRHLCDVERSWLRRSLDGQVAPPLFHTTDGNRDDQFDLVDPDRAADVLAVYRAEVDSSREIAARHELTETVTTRHGDVVSVRWILLHLIEEYSRHNGHADLLREAIDGVRGE